MTAIGAATGGAGLAQRLAVLLGVGIDPVTAWRAVASESDAPEPARVVADGLTTAHSIPGRLSAVAAEHAGWSALAAAWRVADECGAPLGPTLQRLAGVIREGERAESRVRTALAGPIATSRILVALPLAGLLLGAGFGWMRRLVGLARRGPAHPGLGADLVAIALGSGLGPDPALRLARIALAEAGATTSDDVSATLRFARIAGAPAVELLRAEADDARRAAADDAERRGIALGVRLMLPLGLCILPSFVVLGVVPILLSLVGGLRLG